MDKYFLLTYTMNGKDGFRHSYHAWFETEKELRVCGRERRTGSRSGDSDCILPGDRSFLQGGITGACDLIIDKIYRDFTEVHVCILQRHSIMSANESGCSRKEMRICTKI